MRFVSVPCRLAAVRVIQRPQASEERRSGYPVTDWLIVDRRGMLASRIFRDA
jgi:hypothetical protein